MMNIDLYKIGLVVLLASNAILLAVLLVKTTGGGGSSHDESCDHNRMESSSVRNNNGVSNPDVVYFRKDRTPLSENEKIDDEDLKSVDKEYSGKYTTSRKPQHSKLSLFTDANHEDIRYPSDQDNRNRLFEQLIAKERMDNLYLKYLTSDFSRDSKPRDSPVDFDTFYTHLNVIQQSRDLGTQELFRIFSEPEVDDENDEINLRGEEDEKIPKLFVDYFPQVPENGQSSKNETGRRGEKSEFDLDLKSNRFRRSRRSDIEPEPVVEVKDQSKHREQKNVPGRGSTRRPRKRNQRKTKFADRALRRANRIAKRRMSKGKGYNNKKLREMNGIKKIFSTLGDHQVSQMSEMMTNVLLPSLVQFENLVSSHITGMRSALISQELRLERLEKAALEMEERERAAAAVQKLSQGSKPKDLQSDEEDNLTDEKQDKIKNVDDDGDDEILMSGNITIRVKVFGKEEKDEGSGEGEDRDLLSQLVSITTSHHSSTTATAAATTITAAPSTLSSELSSSSSSSSTAAASSTTTSASTTAPSPTTTSTSTSTPAQTTTTTIPSPTTTSTSTTTPTPTTTTTTMPSPTTASSTTTSTTTTRATTVTSTSTTTTTEEHRYRDANYEDLYNFYSTLNQKVDALHSYNMLSATEFNRARALVIKMDDRVTELRRTHKNLRTLTSQHALKLNDMEIENNRIEGKLQAALSNFERIGERFDVFRDQMENFGNDIHKVNAAFATHEQISDELRTADAYKAHDILDIRESVMNVEERVNGMYRVMDEGAISIRYEMEEMIKRVCAINKLMC